MSDQWNKGWGGQPEEPPDPPEPSGPPPTSAWDQADIPGSYGTSTPPPPPPPPGAAPSGAYDYTYGYGVPPNASPAHPRAVPGFVLSLVGLVMSFLCCPVFGLMGIPGVVMGNTARREIASQPGRWTSPGLATAAVVLGWIAIGLCGLMLILFFAFGIAGVFAPTPPSTLR